MTIKGNLPGALKQYLGKSESFNIRTGGQKFFGKGICKRNSDRVFGHEVFANFGFDSLNNSIFLVSVHYDFDLKNLTSVDILIFQPHVVVSIFINNPFKSMERHYPVEMPYKIDETYLLNMEIPAGFPGG